MQLAAAEPANCIGPSLRSDDKMHLRNFTSLLQKSPYPRMIRTVNCKFAVRRVFMGPNGLRAGWRLLIFFAILAPLGIGAGRIIDLLLSKLQADMYTPLGGLAVMGTLVIALLLASNIMARIEHRSIADFGLPWRRAFCRQFWQGRRETKVRSREHRISRCPHRARSANRRKKLPRARALITTPSAKKS
jgi:hypothetical protein